MGVCVSGVVSGCVSGMVSVCVSYLTISPRVHIKDDLAFILRTVGTWRTEWEYAQNKHTHTHTHTHS